jgi:hypothetical protein
MKLDNFPMKMRAFFQARFHLYSLGQHPAQMRGFMENFLQH